VYTLGKLGGGEGDPMAGLAAAHGGGTAGSPRRQLVTAAALRGLSRFAGTRGVPAGREFLLDYDVIEAFCVAGLAGRAPATRGTYRSALYRLAAGANGPPGQRPTPFPGARPPPPYSPAERAELAAVAAAQRDAVKRASALAMVVFGTGAGLRPGELVALRGSGVTRHGRQVVACVSGPAARAVPVTAGYAGRAWQLARRAGSGFVFRPGPAERGYKNFVTSFARTLAADPAAARLTLSRCRPSFICDHLAAGTPAGVLLAIAGICQAGSLARYARHVQGAPSKAVLRAWDKRRQAR
jgi:integrase